MWDLPLSAAQNGHKRCTFWSIFRVHLIFTGHSTVEKEFLHRCHHVTFLVDYSYKNKDGFFISEISVIVALFHKSFVVSPSIGISIIVHVTMSCF